MLMGAHAPSPLCRILRCLLALAYSTTSCVASRTHLRQHILSASRLPAFRFASPGIGLCCTTVVVFPAGATCFFAYLYIRPLIRRGLGSASACAPALPSHPCALLRTTQAACFIGDNLQHNH